MNNLPKREDKKLLFQKFKKTKHATKIPINPQLTYERLSSKNNGIGRNQIDPRLNNKSTPSTSHFQNIHICIPEISGKGPNGQIGSKNAMINETRNVNF